MFFLGGIAESGGAAVADADADQEGGRKGEVKDKEASLRKLVEDVKRKNELGVPWDAVAITPHEDSWAGNWLKLRRRDG